jgi:hypothetical protein
LRKSAAATSHVKFQTETLPFFNESGVGDSWIAREVPPDGSPETHSDLHDVGVRLMRGKRQVGFISLPSDAHAELAVLAIREMRRETVQLPRDVKASGLLAARYQAFLSNRNTRLTQVIAERVADGDTQGSVLSLLIDQLRRGTKAA